MQKQVILLNGPSSSGKSTLSQALQNQIKEIRNEKYTVVSIDDFMKLAMDETIYEDDVFEISGDMCKAVLDAMKICDGVIIDHVITSERIFNQLKSMLEQYRIYLVHVTCPLDVLKKREQERKNRCLGSAQASYTYLFPKTGYDLVVDTHDITPTDATIIIIKEFFK